MASQVAAWFAARGVAAERMSAWEVRAGAGAVTIAWRDRATSDWHHLSKATMRDAEELAAAADTDDRRGG